MKLNTPTRLKPSKAGMYCGSYALCAVTGLPYEDIRTRLNKYRKRRKHIAVMGMTDKEMNYALKHYAKNQDFTVKSCKVKGNPLLV